LKQASFAQRQNAALSVQLRGKLMSISGEIKAHIPYLRRFSRALTGTREGGDDYVLAMLEIVVADQSKISASENRKIALYRLLLDIWSAAPSDAHADHSGAGENEAAARRNLDAISALPRIAFLLNALEGFSLAEIGRILNVSEAVAGAFVEAANSQIADQIASNVLIIEDEPLVALDLREIVEGLGHSVVSIARTNREALAAITARRPGLILADIQLADGSSGIEAVNEILGTLSTPVIFVTAYPERFLNGEPPEPAFLIAKPFSVDGLKAVISQALFFDKRSYRKDADKTASSA
jgi:CheY-like chemotaxis protein/DNA-directed RNA polymerase specialized sigma24 family protein